MKALMLAVLVTGCAADTNRHLSRMGLGASVAGIACDWGQTISAANRSWYLPDHRRQYEDNPIMGAHPSATIVDAYMAATLVAVVAAHYILPESWQPYVYGGVVAVEANTIAGNFASTDGLCGIQGGSPVTGR